MVDSPVFMAPLLGALASRVLRVGDPLHPLDILAVLVLEDRDVSHRRRGGGAVPELLSRRAPDHVTPPDPPNGTAPTLHQAPPRPDHPGPAQPMGLASPPAPGAEPG